MVMIDKGVPIPDRLVIDTGARFPFLKDMEKGDSFMVEIPNDDFFAIEASSVRAAVWRYARMSGRKFISRKVEGGLRIWRLS
jgi:hypothetical protein